MLSTGEGHRDRVLAGLDRARREGKTLGRPQKEIDLEKLTEMRAAGQSMATIKRELDCAKSTVHRTLRAMGISRKKRRVAIPMSTPHVELAWSTTLPTPSARPPKRAMTTTTTELDKRDRDAVLLAIGIAIQKETAALEFCCEQLRGGNGGVAEAIKERERTLRELYRTRERLLSPQTPAA